MNKNSSNWEVVKNRVMKTPGSVLVLFILLIMSVVIYTSSGFSSTSNHTDKLVEQINYPLSSIIVKSVFNHVQLEDISKSLSSLAAPGFMDIKVESVQQTLMSMPWIKDVSVRRVWPDKLEVVLIENVAMAKWGKDGLIDMDGHVFYPAIDELQDIFPHIVCDLANLPFVLQQYWSLGNALQNLGLKIKVLQMNDRKAIQLVLDNNVKLMLGRVDSKARINRFMRAYPLVLASYSQYIEYIDLRYANGFSVKWNNTQQLSLINDTDRNRKT